MIKAKLSLKKSPTNRKYSKELWFFFLQSNTNSDVGYQSMCQFVGIIDHIIIVDGKLMFEIVK